MAAHADCCKLLYFFQGLFFFFFLIFGGLGVRVLRLGAWIGFFGVWISVDGFRTCGVGPSGILGAGALSINIKE